MANKVELIEGFDQFGTTIAQVGRFYTVQGGGNSLIDASAILVEGRAYFAANGSGIVFNLPADDEYYIGYHFWNTSANPLNGTGPRFFEGATEHGRLVFNADHTISMTRAGTALTGGTSAVVGPWLLNIPHFLEVYYKVHDSAGAFEVKLDGNTICSGSGLDTRNGGTLGVIDNVPIAGGPNIGAVVDNFYAASGSAGFQGEGRVVTDVATADGAHTDWTPNTGARWQAVDDVPADDDTTYISDATSTNRNSFLMATFGVTGLIRAVAVAIQGRKDDAGTRQVQLGLRSGGTDYDDATVVDLVTAYAGFQRIWNADPDTASAFDPADIDAIEPMVVTV